MAAELLCGGDGEAAPGAGVATPSCLGAGTVFSRADAVLESGPQQAQQLSSLP